MIQFKFREILKLINPKNRHPRAGGDPTLTQNALIKLVSRLRGNDEFLEN
jgi:hypothetical protein